MFSKQRFNIPATWIMGFRVMTNRGFAILGDRLYMATLVAHLVALDAKC
jgi:hypothetical protein